MLTVLLIVVPACLVGVALYALMGRWEIPLSDSTYSGDQRRPMGRARSPQLPFRETMFDWPVPQLRRLNPAVLIGTSVALGLWILAWIVLLLVGLNSLYS